jgi:hypothetical protein
MERISLENDGDKGIILTKVMNKFVSNFENLGYWKIRSKLETRGCVVEENLWECINLKLLIF